LKISTLIKINVLTVIILIIFYLTLNIIDIAKGSYCIFLLSEIPFICPIGLLQRPDLIKASTYSMLIGLAITLILIIVLGRVFCGWLCPIGILIRFTNKKARSSEHSSILACFISLITLFFVSWTLGYPVFCLICPIGIVSRIIISAVSGIFDIWGIIWGAIIFLLIMAMFTDWCDGICPLGALQTLLSFMKIVRIKVNDNCIKCNACMKACPLRLKIYQKRKTDQMKCIVCLRCIAICPAKALKLTLHHPSSSNRNK